MDRTHLILTAILLCAALPVSSAKLMASSSAQNSSPQAVVKGNTSFAVDLYHQLATTEGNLFFSPYSISSALGMTYAGARGNTAREIQEVMHFQLDQTQLHPAFNRLNQELQAAFRKTNQKLSIANGLCLTGSGVNDSFKTLLKDNYEAAIFRGKLDEINNWVKQKTEGRIEKILDVLKPNSVCVLLNAIYFKGTWESQFDKSRTHQAPFKVSSDKQVTATLMYQKSAFKVLSEEGFQAVSIPYQGKRLSMIVRLPREADGLSQLESQLTHQSLNAWLAKLQEQPAQKLRLYLPKYKLETDYDLIPPCTNLGMKDAFNANAADFSGIGGPKGELWIAQAVHKAFVEVNEEGTEAAGATAVEVITKGGRPGPEFAANHPFLFIIQDQNTNNILFMGRVVNPS